VPFPPAQGIPMRMFKCALSGNLSGSDTDANLGHFGGLENGWNRLDPGIPIFNFFNIPYKKYNGFVGE
jgi:hypothetical protein